MTMMLPSSLLCYLLLLLATTTSALTATAFPNKCVEYLLAKGEADGVLSTSEFASFISDVIGSENDFQALEVPLQLRFVWLLCDDSSSTQKRATCISNLQANSGISQGYSFTNSNANLVRAKLEELCWSIIEYIGIDVTTPAPTSATTGQPSQIAQTTPAPITAKPSTEAPQTLTPSSIPSFATGTDKPITAAPVMAKPRTPAPISSAPPTIAPTMAKPATTAPTASVPTPTTTAPISSVPIPTTTAPISSVPTPTTTAPISSVPTPTTTAPAMAKPTNTLSPIIHAPTTAAPTTAAPTTSTPSSSFLVSEIGGSLQPVASSSKETMSGGAWAGIAIAGAVVVIAGFVFTRRRPSADGHSSKGPVHDILGDESFSVESEMEAYAIRKDLLMDGNSIKGSSHGSDTSSVKALKADQQLAVTKCVSQFDPSTAAAIALYRREVENNSLMSSSSFYTPRGDSPLNLPPGVDTETYMRRKLDDLGSAIRAADWNGVYKIASSIAGSEELSSMSGRISALAMPDDIESHTSGSDSIFFDSSPRKTNLNLDDENEIRAAALDHLVEHRDWAGVARTAGGFATADGTMGSASPQKRSFIGFVTGRRTSAAAEAAISSASSVDSSYNESASGRVGAAPLDNLVREEGDFNEYAFLSLLGREHHNTISTASDSSGASPEKNLKTPRSAPNASIISLGTVSPGTELPQRSGVADMVNTAVATTAVIVAASNSFDDPPRTQSSEHIQVQKEKGKRRWRDLFRRTTVSMDNTSTSQPTDRSPAFKIPDDDEDSELNSPLGIKSYRSDSSLLQRANSSFDESHVSYVSLRTDLDRAVLRGDWAIVESLSAEVEATDPTPKKMPSVADVVDQPLGAMSRSAVVITRSDSMSSSSIFSLRCELDHAVDRGDWTLVEKLANQLMSSSPEKRMAMSHLSPSKYMILSDDERILISTPRKAVDWDIPFRTPPVADDKSLSSSTVDSVKVKKMGKVVANGKWSTVTALAGVYLLEERGSLPSTPRRAPATSSPRQAVAVTSSLRSSHDSDIQYFAAEWTGITRTGGEKSHSTLALKPTETDDCDNEFSIVAMMARQSRPSSPDPSLSSVSVENDTLRELERLVEKGDWQGLVNAVSREEGFQETPKREEWFTCASDITDVGRQLEPTGMRGTPVSNITDEVTNVALQPVDIPGAPVPNIIDEGTDVVLRPVDLPKPKEFHRVQNKESFHGAKLLIPYWENAIPTKMA